MPRVATQQTNFTAGEISPRLAGRTDIDRYANAARLLENVYPVIHGGAKRRPGTRFVQATKISAKRSRLIPFVYSRDDAYMLEFGDLYQRVYKNGAALGVEVVTPYTEAMLPDIDYVQGEDTMFLAHPSGPIQRLRRFSDTAWDLSPAPFLATPFSEQGHALAATLTLSSAAVGTGRTATASAAVFLPSDVGRQLVCGSGLGVVTGYTDTTHLTVTITIAFASTSLTSGTWLLDASPQAIVVPSAKDPVASVITLTGCLSRAATLTLAAKTGTGIAVTASASVFTPADVGKTLYADSGVALITAQTGTGCTINITTDFAATSYAQGGWGIPDSVWRSGDVGKYVRINGGLAKITSFGSASAVLATVVSAMTGIVACPPLAWSLEDSVWSASNGYPRTVTMHEQRLVAAGSTKYPQTIWGSRTGEYLDFTGGTADDDGYSFTIANDEVNPISYVASLRNMVVHTYGGEFSLQGGIEKPITPTNVRIRPESAHGSRGVRPVLIGKESVFVQRAGRKVRAMGYRYDVDGYACPDLSVLAEHITSSGVVGLAYQQEPDLLLWAVRSDGGLLSCTIDREQQVIGWARHFTDGAFESVATIPVGDREETWVIVRRTVNGSDVRYVERFDETFEPILAAAPSGYPPLAEVQVWGATADCCLSFDSVPGQAVITGLGHLEGKTVWVLADGAVLPERVVASGQITLPRAAHRVLVGLPFVSRVGLLTPEIGTGTGSAQGNSMHTSEVSVRFLNTLGAEVYDGDSRLVGELSFRRFGPEVLDQPAQPFTGIKRIEKLGWERGRDEITIVQAQPLPMHVLSVMRKYQVND